MNKVYGRNYHKRDFKIRAKWDKITFHMVVTAKGWSA
jgi:hypothetical protein